LSVAHANLAHTFYRQKRYQDAERAYRNAIRVKPENAIPYSGLAMVLTEMKRYPEAVQACRDAIARYGPRDQNLSAFYVNLGVALYSQGKRDQALEAIGRAKSLGRTSDPAYDIIERGVIKK
jgi:tetratricopeptide (TPR) repeat protein